MPTKNFDRMNPGCVLDLRGYEGSGQAIHDVSKYRNNGTGTAITWSQLASGLNTMVFDGATSYVTITDTAGLDIVARPMSTMVWVKPTGLTGYILCRNLDGTANRQYALLYDDATDAVLVCLEGTQPASSANSSIPAGSWALVGFTWAADGTVQAFVNGVASGSSASVATALTSRPNIQFGRRATANVYFQGSLALPRVFNTALSADHIKHLYEQERYLFGV